MRAAAAMGILCLFDLGSAGQGLLPLLVAVAGRAVLAALLQEFLPAGPLPKCTLAYGAFTDLGVCGETAYAERPNPHREG